MSTVTKSELCRELKISITTLRRELKKLGLDTGNRRILWPSEQRLIRAGLDSLYGGGQAA